MPGVRVEKGQVSNSSTITLPTAAATGRDRRRRCAIRRRRRARRRVGPGGAVRRRRRRPAAARRFGTISGVKGNTLYVTGATGNVTKVKLSSATKITKSLGVKRSSLHPGDTVVIRGLKNSKGSLVAASVSDSGASAGGFGAAGGGGSSSGGSTGSASSAVGSLFSSGG